MDWHNNKEKESNVMSINAITCPELVSPFSVSAQQSIVGALPALYRVPEYENAKLNSLLETGYSRRHSSSSSSSRSSNESQSVDHTNLSLIRRREKNKAASAKYRAKKLSITNSMQTHIMYLTSQVKNLENKLVETQQSKFHLMKEYQNFYNHCKHHHLPAQLKE
ncbi:hypothetical protein BY458DRAFT_528681 [Sporodiniella umbellata]|nr:hypothetical protein BY458DRAFT_528681 [Sporodiniella umbellata]